MLTTPLLQPGGVAADESPPENLNRGRNHKPHEVDAAAGGEPDKSATGAGGEPEKPATGAGGEPDKPATRARDESDKPATGASDLHGSTSDTVANRAGDESPKSKRAGHSEEEPPRKPESKRPAPSDEHEPGHLEPPNGEKKAEESVPSDAKMAERDMELGLAEHMNIDNANLPASLVHRPSATLPSEDNQIQVLRDDSRRFAESAAGSSMASEATSFFKAVDEFSARKEKTKKIADTKLSKTGRSLCAAACRAPASEAALAAVAVKITGESFQILLSSSEDRSYGLRRPIPWRTWLDQLRAAIPISGPEPMLPVHRNHLEKLIAKRQVLFGVTLMAPVALLTSAAAAHVFPSASGPWIAGVTAAVWITVSLGALVNQYGKTDLELVLASCLGRLGMMGLSVLLCVYVFAAFFPSTINALWVLVGFAVVLHGLACILSRMGGDDKPPVDGGTDEESEFRGCRCTCNV